MGTLVRYAKPRTHYRPRYHHSFDQVLEGMYGEMSDGTTLPAVDVREEEESYVLEADLPGAVEKDIELQVHDEHLTIGTRKPEPRKGAKMLIQERQNRGFSRRFALPKDTDVQNISASFVNGVLKIEIAKAAETKPRSIKIGRS